MHRRRYGRRPARLALGTGFAAAVLAPSAVSAQLFSADYTAAEAEAGRAIYEQACATCHMSNLTGSFEAPELAGPTFRGAWGDPSRRRADRAGAGDDAAGRRGLARAG